jgi:predicted Zn-dependent protease
MNPKRPTRSTRWRAAALAGLLCLTPAWPQRQALPALGDGDSLSLSEERMLGDRIARELYRDPDHLEDPVLDEYIQRLWRPLVQAAVARGELSADLQERFAWRLLLGRDRSVNAFALPGGYLGVHLGLIAVVGSDDELASVLAHELSHVTQRHIARSMGEQARMMPLLMGAMLLGVLAAGRSAQGAQAAIVGGQAAAIQSQLSYSRDMEREADRIGYGVLAAAGYDTRSFVSMFGKLQQAAGVNDSGAFPYLRSHPLTTERIADMQARQQLDAPRPPHAQDMAQALMAARARVLAQPNIDAWRAWAREADTTDPRQLPAQRAAGLYAATLALGLMRDFAAAERALDRLDLLTTSADTARQARLLRAELAAWQGQHAQVLALLYKGQLTEPWPRPELIALAQALVQLPGHALQAEALRQLRELVQREPLDAQAWNTLASLQSAQGLSLAALRSEGEAQMARMDWSGAVDRWRAAQNLARQSGSGTVDHIEASIVDSRLRAAQQLLREQQRQR